MPSDAGWSLFLVPRGYIEAVREIERQLSDGSTPVSGPVDDIVVACGRWVPHAIKRRGLKRDDGFPAIDSGFRFRVSGFEFQVSGFWVQASRDFRRPTGCSVDCDTREVSHPLIYSTMYSCQV